MAKELLVSVAIGATLTGAFTTVFGRAEKTAKTLGNEIKSATAANEAFGKAIRARMALNPTRELGSQSRAYAAMTVQIAKATQAQDNLNKAIAAQAAAAQNRQRLRGEMMETAGHAAVAVSPIVAGVRKFIEQEDAAIDLKVAMMQKDGSFGKFEKLDKLAIQWGGDLPGNKTDFSHMIRGLKSQGISDDTIIKGGGLATAQLNTVMGIPIADGSFFAKNMEAHGIKESELLASADLTQRAYFAAGLSKEDMYQAMSYYAPKANTLGLTGLENQKQIYAVEGLAANKGLEGSSFGTNFSMMLSQLAKGPKMVEAATRGMKSEVREIMEASGAKFEFFDTKGNLKSLRDVTQELESGYNKVRAKFGDEGAMKVFDEIFQQEGGRVASILAQAGIAGFDGMMAKMDNQASIDKRIEVRTSSLSSAFEQLGGVVENTAAKFGEVFAPEIKAFANTAQWLIENWVMPFVENNKGLIKIVFGLLAGFFALKLTFLGFAYAASMVAMPFRALLTGFYKVKALKSIWSLLRLAQVSRGVAVFRTLGFSAANAAKAAALFGKVAAPFTAAFARIGAGVGVFGKLSVALGILRQAVFALGRAFLATPIGLAVAGIAIAALLIYKYWKPIKAFFAGFWEGLKQGLAPLQPLFDSIGSALGGLWQTIQPFVQPVIDWFKDFFSITQVAEGGARSFGESVGLWIGEKIAAVAAWVGGKIGEIKAAFSGGLSGILALIINWSPLGAFYSAFSAVLSWFGVSLPATFTGFGQMILQGLWNGLKAKFEEVKGWFSGVAGWFGSVMQQKNEIESPSRLFKRFGGFMMEGLQIGLANGA
ncbi:phage tail tape measure protein, partial [Paralysiella testudinis]